MRNFTMRLLAVMGAVTLLLTGCSDQNSSSSSSEGSSSSNGGTEASTMALTDLTYDFDENTQLLQFTRPEAGDTIAVLKTSMGDITLQFFPEQAPKAVENFLAHAEDGYYNGLKFHRVIDNFMIQGGDPLGTGMGGESIWGTAFEDEFSTDLFVLRGALAMANSGANTNGSQFFVVQASQVSESLLGQMAEGGWPEASIEAYKTIGGAPWLDQKHTVFGQVLSGMDVVDAIAKVETKSDVPVEDVIVEEILVYKVQ